MKKLFKGILWFIVALLIIKVILGALPILAIIGICIAIIVLAAWVSKNF